MQKYIKITRSSLAILGFLTVLMCSCSKPKHKSELDIILEGKQIYGELLQWEMDNDGGFPASLQKLAGNKKLIGINLDEWIYDSNLSTDKDDLDSVVLRYGEKVNNGHVIIRLDTTGERVESLPEK